MFPPPVQQAPKIWITAGGSPATFENAGRMGASILTNLLVMSHDDLVANLAAYRAAYREAGHPGDGHVTLMLHTFVGRDVDAVKRPRARAVPRLPEDVDRPHQQGAVGDDQLLQAHRDGCGRQLVGPRPRRPRPRRDRRDHGPRLRALRRHGRAVRHARELPRPGRPAARPRHRRDRLPHRLRRRAGRRARRPREPRRAAPARQRRTSAPNSRGRSSPTIDPARRSPPTTTARCRVRRPGRPSRRDALAVHAVDGCGHRRRQQRTRRARHVGAADARRRGAAAAARRRDPSGAVAAAC